MSWLIRSGQRLNSTEPEFLVVVHSAAQLAAVHAQLSFHGLSPSDVMTVCIATTSAAMASAAQVAPTDVCLLPLPSTCHWLTVSSPDYRALCYTPTDGSAPVVFCAAESLEALRNDGTATASIAKVSVSSPLAIAMAKHKTVAALVCVTDQTKAWHTYQRFGGPAPLDRTPPMELDWDQLSQAPHASTTTPRLLHVLDVGTAAEQCLAGSPCGAVSGAAMLEKKLAIAVERFGLRVKVHAVPMNQLLQWALTHGDGVRATGINHVSYLTNTIYNNF